MHGYSRLGRPSTPSPPSSPRFRHGRSKHSVIGGSAVGGSFGGVGGNGGDAKLQNILERLLYMVVAGVYRRRGVLLFAPLLYISGMLLYMGSLGFDIVVVSDRVSGKAAPMGSVYRSPQVFEKLWPFMEAENNGTSSNAVRTFILMHTYRTCTFYTVFSLDRHMKIFPPSLIICMFCKSCFTESINKSVQRIRFLISFYQFKCFI